VIISNLIIIISSSLEIKRREFYQNQNDMLQWLYIYILLVHSSMFWLYDKILYVFKCISSFLFLLFTTHCLHRKRKRPCKTSYEIRHIQQNSYCHWHVFL